MSNEEGGDSFLASRQGGIITILARGSFVAKHVLIFDSGVGGLSVYQEIRHLLPDISYTYLFDNAKFPYGELSSEELIPRCCSLIQNLLVQQPADLVVIACNTASTQVLPALRSLLSIPVVGVVPAIKPAAQLTRTGCIGLLATPATIARPYTDKLIREFASDCTVLRLGSTELVVEAERKLGGLEVDLDRITTILAPWLQAPRTPDVLILGCTHFPLLKAELHHVLPTAQLVDSGPAVARRVRSQLELVAVRNVPQIFENGVAYCSKLDQTAMRLVPALQSFGFMTLRELKIEGPIAIG